MSFLKTIAAFTALSMGTLTYSNAGHSHATFEQVEAAIGWGVRHIDHLFCAMSDRARLRQAVRQIQRCLREAEGRFSAASPTIATTPIAADANAV